MPCRDRQSCCFHRAPARKAALGLPGGGPPLRHTEGAGSPDAVLLAYQEGYRHFLCGMAQGCDLYFCEAVLALREQSSGGHGGGRHSLSHPGGRLAGGGAAALPRTGGRRATWRPWSPTRYSLQPVCSGGTATWWTTPCCSSPPLTAPPAGPATRWNTPCGGESRSLMCRFPRNSCKMKLLYCIDARRGSSSERAWMV